MESWWSDATPGDFMPSECFIDLFMRASILNEEDGLEDVTFKYIKKCLLLPTCGILLHWNNGEIHIRYLSYKAVIVLLCEALLNYEWKWMKMFTVPYYISQLSH